jgi:hypothetical protein
MVAKSCVNSFIDLERFVSVIRAIVIGIDLGK